MLLNGTLNIPEGMSELEVREAVTAMAEKNKVYKTVLRGAGAYRHFIPAVVKSITSREELVTCYTPYQAEISQGVLQGTFEFQTMICELTGMDVANASPLRRRDRRRRDHPHVPRPQAYKGVCFRLREPAGHRGHADLLLCLEHRADRRSRKGWQNRSRRAQGRARRGRRVLLPPAAELLRADRRRKSHRRACPCCGREVRHGREPPSPVLFCRLHGDGR